MNLHISNPFLVHGLADHPRLLSSLAPVQISHVHVSGLIKFRLQFDSPNMPQKTRAILAQQQRRISDQMSIRSGQVSYLPKDFGRGLNLDDMDSRLLKFCKSNALSKHMRAHLVIDLVAFCAGRTLLEWSNVWKGIPAIAQKSSLVKHAMLSKAAGYVLDYAPSTKLKRRANHHHRRAVTLLGLELNKAENYEIGKEEPLLMGLALLNNEDLVHWEMRALTFPTPKWYSGNKLVKYLLDKSDPGYQYHNPVNVQSTNNRYCMSHYQMKSLILSDTCAPLEDPGEENPFSWLLEGSEREVRRITGLLGCCPKLLHMLSQITHMSWQLAQRPKSHGIQTAGNILLERLVDFQQWSELMEVPYETPEDLFDACRADFDETGKVKTARLSVALNAESFVQSARAYLLCRFFRLPRRHPEVQKTVANLIKCTDWVPLDGPLYTAQDSLFGLAIAGILAIDPGDRAIVRGQFAECEIGPRGNDTPVWYALENIWLCLDREALDDSSGEEALTDRTPWWELMVQRIFETEGRLSLL